MRRQRRWSRSITVTAAFALLPASLVAQSTGPGESAWKFFPDDPLLQDNDRHPIEEPGEIELSTAYDILRHSIGGEGSGNGRAQNVNTLGEVPDSSWFTNRLGVREMSIEEMVRGAETAGEPDLTGGATVIAGKSGGITPGFTIRDGRGDVFFIKFDPPEYVNLASAADVIVSKFFHAIGYNVPENYIAYLDSDRLRIDPEAMVAIAGKGDQPMTRVHLAAILERAGRSADGRIRVVASRALPGSPIGPFQFYGTRGDDPNDIFPHEHRRELRGYRAFCAWLNHDDSRSLNTLDSFVSLEDSPGLGYVRHYLLDFSSALGSGSNAARQIAPQNPRAGNEYYIEVAPIWKTALSLGLWERPWRKVEFPWPGNPALSEIGRIEAEFFQPEQWKPEYPNPAFDRMLDDDAFWAAKIVARFSDEAIRALVATGQYANADAERYLADTLIARRDKVVDTYLRRLNPLDEFTVRADGTGAFELRFKNLADEYGLGQAASSYEVEWFEFDNANGSRTPLGSEAVQVDRPAVSIPSRRDVFLMARIRTTGDGEPAWQKAVDVYLRLRGQVSVVGIDREL